MYQNFNRYNDQVQIRPQVVPTSHVTHMTAILWRTLIQLSSNYSWQPRHLGPIIPQPTNPHPPRRSLNAQGPGIVMVFNCALLSFMTVKIGHNVFIVLASIKILFLFVRLKKHHLLNHGFSWFFFIMKLIVNWFEQVWNIAPFFVNSNRLITIYYFSIFYLP